MPRSPSLVTCTSSEFLGGRPLRRIVLARPVVVIMGEARTGKSSVASRIARASMGPALSLDGKSLQHELVARARTGAWSVGTECAGTLVLDGPTFVRCRPAAAKFLRELLSLRIAAGRRTILCETPRDRSLDTIVSEVPAGAMVTIGLRFPNSRSGRMRFARRCCDGLDLPRSHARGTDLLEPWGYDAVTSALQQRADDAYSGAAAAQR